MSPVPLLQRQWKYEPPRPIDLQRGRSAKWLNGRRTKDPSDPIGRAAREVLLLPIDQRTHLRFADCALQGIESTLICRGPHVLVVAQHGIK